MTTPAHGYVPAQYLAPLSGSTVEAEKNTATAFARIRAAYPAAHITGPAGGYWSHDFSVHIHSSAAVAATYGISASEFKLLAGIGNSPHELGTRINVAGVSAAVMKAYGFTLFNGYTYTYNGPYSWNEVTPVSTGPGASTLTSDEVKRVATYLNSRAAALGHPTSAASSNGIQGKLYWTLVQAAGAADGLYPQPAYKINGAPGTRTYWLEEHYRDITAPVVSLPPVITPPPLTTPPVIEEPPVEAPPATPPADSGEDSGTDPAPTPPSDSGAPDSGEPPVETPPDSGGPADSGEPADSGSPEDSGSDTSIPKPTPVNVKAILTVIGAVLAAIAALIFGH